MRYRKGVFLVVYRKEKGRIRYLVLHRKLHWKGWEFPKAGVKGKEKVETTVKRELKEETGLKSEKTKRFNVFGKYNYKKEIPERKLFFGQTYTLFAVEVGKKKIRLDREEHDRYRWLGFKGAEKILTWKNQRKCLKIVDRWLRKA